MTKHFLSIVFLTTLIISVAYAQNAAVPIPDGPFLSKRAIWRHDLGSTALANHVKGQCDYIIKSEISTLTGQQRIENYGLLIKVTAWGKPFTATDMPPKPDKKTMSGEILKVILNPTDDATQMRVEYEDTVYEKGKVKLKFSGSTLLRTWE